MAQRRMFSKEVIQTEWFTDMPAAAQMLYIHLSMDADDDGFVTNTKVAMLYAHASKDDLSILIAKKYVIQVESGLYLMKHWRQNNYLRSDRYKPSPYTDRLSNFDVKEDGSYTEKKEVSTTGIPSVNQMDTQNRLVKESIDKGRLEEISEGGMGETFEERKEHWKKKLMDEGDMPF